MKDRIVRVSFFESKFLPSDACQQKAQAGISCGLLRASEGSGTLGGIVQLLMPETNEWVPYGLTCFHCLYPGMRGTDVGDLARK